MIDRNVYAGYAWMGILTIVLIGVGFGIATADLGIGMIAAGITLALFVRGLWRSLTR